MTTTDTVDDRIAAAVPTLTPLRLALTLGLLALLGGGLLFGQEALLHDSMHGFRHAAGIVCH